jgi:hypothetical protein
MKTIAAPMRAFLGFVAGAIAVLVFHQGMWMLLHAVGQIMQTPYQTRPVPPFGVPYIADLCFWGGVYGMIYALVQPQLQVPRWASGLALGFVAVLVGWFVVAPLKGLPAANGWNAAPMLRALLINLTWGLGVALILPLLKPRLAVRA